MSDPSAEVVASSGATGHERTRRSDSVPLRVLHIWSGNLYGGVEAFLKTLAAAPHPGMVTEFALCFEGRLSRELRVGGAGVHRLGMVRARYPWTLARGRRRLARLLKEHRFDVVVCHSVWPHAMFAPTVRGENVPLVFYLHDAVNAGHWLEQRASRFKPDLVICNSRYTAETVTALFPLVLRRVVHCPVPPVAGGSEIDRSVLRASLATDDGAVVIVQASRMQSWKGQRLLLEALGRIKDERRWTCWIVGDAQRAEERAYRAELESMATRLDIAERVRFLGQRSDVTALLRAADIYCQPNERPEPFGIAFVEALAAGLPVVATAMGGALEIVNDSCGALVPVDAERLARVLVALIQDPEKRAALAKEAPARARAVSDVSRQVSAIAEALVVARDGAGKALDVIGRAQQSAGQSDDAIHALVRRVLASKGEHYGHAFDLGCGKGWAARSLEGMYERYTGVDVVQYAGFPRSANVSFAQANLDHARLPLADGVADLLVSIETIEHLENPRGLVREMARIVRPGGRIVLTTPNQLSLASKLFFLTRHQFQAFQEAPGLYPGHITALVEEDLRRIAHECGFIDIEIHFTDCGRIPLTSKRWPLALGARGRWFSDNVLLTARRPVGRSDT